MGKSQKGRVANLSRTLQRVTASLNESFALLDTPAPAGSAKLDWAEVKKAADVVSKHATTIGLLWTQPLLKVDEAEEAMKTLADSLQGLILLCHGFTVGAGPTLAVTIRNAVKGVLGAGLSLLTSAVSFSVKGSSKEERESALPALVGCVWESCNVIKKTPYTNRAAIGRSLAQVATSVKDVLREIGEMRVDGKEPEDDGCGCGHAHEIPSGSHSHSLHNHSHSQSSHNHSHSHGSEHGHGACGHDHGHSQSLHNHSHSHSHGSEHGHGACGHDHSHSQSLHNHSHSHSHGSEHGHGACGHDHGHEHEDGACSSTESLEFNDELSPEELEVADATKTVVTSVLAFVKELLYVAADPQQGNDEAATLYLETILQQCKSLGVQVDEFGASLYPPQETNQLRDRGVKTDVLVGGITEEVKAAKGSVPDGLAVASTAVNTALAELKQHLGGLS